VRYFNQESYEELLWWIQVPALVAATPAELRSAVQRIATAMSAATKTAKDTGYRMDVLLAAASRAVAANKISNGTSASPATVRKTSKKETAEVSSKKAKSTDPETGLEGGTKVATGMQKSSTVKTKRTPTKATPDKNEK
jgi:hypothetical protein